MKKEFKIIINTHENDVLKEKTIFYFQNENELEKSFNYLLKNLINNKYQVNIYNKMNHIQAFNKNKRIDVSISNF